MTGWQRLGLIGLLVAAVGCTAKLDVERSYEIEQLDRRIVGLPAQSREQTVTATVNSDQPVDVYAIPASVGDLDTLDAGQLKAKASASSERMTTGTFKFTVPAKQETNVVVTPSAKTAKAKVSLKLTN